MKLLCKTWLITAMLIALPASNALAQLSDPDSLAQTWDRSAALSSSRSVDIKAEVVKLVNPATLTDGKSTVQALIDLSQRKDWPAPAREAAIYDFTRALASRPSQTVNPDILEFLAGYQPQVLIAGEHGDKQPLFNIRAAAAGVENSWLRVDSAQQASSSLHEGIGKWLARYAAAQHPAERSGYLDALRLEDFDTVSRTQTEALAQLRDDKTLTAVVAATIVLSYDSDAAHQLLSQGQGTALAPALEKLTTVLDKDELALLLEFAVQQSPTENAALAIASWGSILSTQPDTRQLLIDTLADRDLGSAAALALATKPNIQTIRELQLLAQGQGLAAQRAQLALSINRESLIQEQRR